GLSMLSGMSMVNRIANQHNRSGLLSTYLVIGYIGSMLPMMGMGWIADYWGMNVAVCTFGVFVMVMGTVIGVLFRRNPRMQSASSSAH
ncbi:MAG: MFS transporter, partial [Comamonas sp.]